MTRRIFAALNTLQVLPVDRIVQRRDPGQLGALPAAQGRKFAQRRAQAKALSDKNLSESFNLAKATWSNCAARRAGDLERRRGRREEVKSHVSVTWKNRD